PKAPVRQQGDADLLGDGLVKEGQKLALILVALASQFGLLDGLPAKGRGAAVAGNEVESQGGMVVLLEVGPVQGDHDLFTRAQDKGDPELEESRKGKGLIGEEA